MVKRSYPINLVRIFWWNISDKGSDKSTVIAVRPFSALHIFPEKIITRIRIGMTAVKNIYGKCRITEQVSFK